MECTLKYVYDLVYAGKLDATKDHGRWRISREAVDAWRNGRLREGKILDATRAASRTGWRDRSLNRWTTALRTRTQTFRFSRDEQVNTIKDHDSLSRFIAEDSRRDSARRCSFPVETARQMGVTDEQIISYRARITGFDVAAAPQAGCSNEEIIRYLSAGDEIPIDDSQSAGSQLEAQSQK